MTTLAITIFQLQAIQFVCHYIQNSWPLQVRSLQQIHAKRYNGGEF